MKYIEEFIRYLKVVRKDSDYTLTNYKNDLLELYDFYQDLLEIDEMIVKEYLEYLYHKNLNRNSISRKLSAIRSFYNYLLKENIIKTNYFKEISNPKKAHPLPKYIKNNDLEKMFASFDTTKPLEQRNSLILEMLYATGIRVGELVNIKLEDINIYNHSIKILGKGSKERIVYYGLFCENALELYLQDGRKKILNHSKNDYLFINKNKTQLSERYIREIINNLIQKCQINYHVSPHTLRHTFATDMLNAGADLISVKELLGHSSLDTTSIYINLTNEQIKKTYFFAHPRAKR